jgi:hypothetical protein
MGEESPLFPRIIYRTRDWRVLGCRPQKCVKGGIGKGRREGMDLYVWS